MSEPRRPDLEPLKTNDTAAILVGTCLWAVALVILLIARPSPDHQWWIWTCVVGIGGGLFGLWFVRRRDRVLAAKAAEQDSARSPAREGDRDGTGGRDANKPGLSGTRGPGGPAH